MGFFDRFLSRAPQAPLPSLGELLEARGVTGAVPGLEPLVPAFEAHRDLAGREDWAEAVAATLKAGLPLPPPWMDAQEGLVP